jgi:hypothetical protein
MKPGNESKPSTRWAIAPPWLAARAPLPGRLSPGAPVVEARPVRDAPAVGCGTSSTSAALIELLRRDIEHENRWVALRHFLMARACGVSLPADLRQRCEPLLQECPPKALSRIERGVEAWVRMTRKQGPVAEQRLVEPARG